MRLKTNQYAGRKFSWTLFSLVVLCMLTLSGHVHGQGLGRIAGTVQDASGAVILNASVTVTEAGKGFSRTATTDTSGFYVLNSLRPAQYDLSVEASGFHTFDKKAITLLADQTLTLNVSMQVGAVTETVAVVSQTDQVDTTTSTLKQVIEQERITELPLNGRNAATLTLTVAGAVQAPSGGADQGSTKTFPGAVTISANGARQNQISYQLDGGNNVDEYTNVNQPFPMPDALQEFSVQTSNYSAQYGQNAGAVVNVVTRSGSNQFHGNAFEFVRNRALNARPWASFDTVVNGVVTQKAQKDQIKRNQFGGTFGGPIRRDKTFFFAGYQRTYFRNIAAGVTATVPSAALRATATDPAIINLLKGIPVGDSNNKVSYSGRPDIQDFQEVTARFDHSFSQKDQLTVRYFFDHFSRNAVFDPSNFLRYSDGSTIKSQNYLGHWTHVFNPTLINDFRFSYAPENATRGPASNAQSVQDLGVALPFEAPQKSIQQIRVNGFFSFGDNPQASFIRNNFTWGDDISLVRNKHDLHFGGVLERSKVILNNQFFQPAEFSFPSITAFLAGKLGDYSGNLAFRQGAGEYKNNRNTFIGLYFQDNYKFSRRLTLNLGLRWEPALPWRELDGKVEQFRLGDLIAGRHSTQYPGAPAGVFFPGDAGVPSQGVRANYSNFAPRVGFAYDVFGNAKTSLRGGFGVFYDTRIPGIINNRFVDLSPFSPQLVFQTGVVNPGTFSDPLCTKAATQAAQGCTSQAATYPFPFTYPPKSNFNFGVGTFVLSWDPVNNYQTPTVYNWNLAVEHQLPSNILMRVAYVGSHSSHLTETLNLNPRPVGGTSTTPFRLNAIAATVTTPFPGCTAANCPLFSTVQQDLQDINANYHSLQMGVEKRVSHGLTVLANYTWSRSTDDLPPGAGVLGFDTSSARPWDDPLRHQFDTGPSEFDHKHRFVGSYVWELPGLKGRNALVRGFLGGWQFSGLLQAQTGRPVTALSGADRSGTAIGLDRADLVGPAYGTVTDSTGYQTEAVGSATKTMTPVRDLPQSITVVTSQQIRDQSMTSIADVVNYVPGITSHQGENNRDQLVIRGNSTSADFFLNGVRDDVQYYRDLYNVEQLEALKGPNAMIFGRGGGGGVINRVTKEAGFTALREVTLQGGSFGNKRFTLDFDQPLGNKVALRVNGLYEDSDNFRRFVNLERYGINPTLTFVPSAQTKITLGLEHFHDARTADRGIPSFQGRPADTPISTFFGNPNDSHVWARVDLASAAIDHQVGWLNIRNRTLFGKYDRGYQNFVPGAVTADKTKVALSAYNNATKRQNIFNQTDLTYVLSTGRVRQTFIAGAELGRQLTDNFRNTGFFNNTATSILAAYENPAINTPVTFRQSATDADNHVKTNLAASYVQDQIEFSRYVQVVAGVRFDYFDLQFHNNRTSDNLRRVDQLVSPRAGIVVKPIVPLSLYANYSVSYLPSSGDQFSSLTVITRQAEPEKFTNYELGVKWDIHPHLSLTTAAYRQHRNNTRATDPNDPTRILQTGSQRTNGIEIGMNGNVTRAWRISGGYAYQNAFISSATTAAKAGAQVAEVPHHTFSLWDHYQIRPKLAVGLGLIHRSDMYAAVDNTVVLPGYVRADVAAYYSFNEKWRFQANIENLFSTKFYLNADGNNNISPGRPRCVRLGLIARF